MKIDTFKIKMIVLLSFLFVFKNSFSLKIMENVKVENVKVYLSDLIITTDKEIFDEASKISITRLLTPGERVEISGERIAIKLRSITNTKFEIPKKIIVRRDFRVIKRDELNEVLQNKLDEYYKDKKNVIYSMKLNVARKLRVPVGKIDYEIDKKKLESRKYGKFQVYLLLYNKNGLAQKIPFLIELKKIIVEYYLTKDVKKGEEFDSSFVEEKEKQVYYDSNTNKFSPKNAKGLVYQDDLKAGHKLLIKDLDERNLVEKGNIVKLHLKFGNVVINDLGEALESGKAGDIILLRNIRSKKKIQGKILADGTVEIEF